MQEIKRKMSGEPNMGLEWIEEILSKDQIQITVLQIILKSDQLSAFDLVTYIGNVINCFSNFKIVYFEYQSSYKLSNFTTNFYKNSLHQIKIIQCSKQYINDWLKTNKAAPFLIKFVIKEQSQDILEQKLNQSTQIAKFIKTQLKLTNVVDLKENIIQFISDFDEP